MSQGSYILPSIAADRQITDSGVLLDELNKVFGTSYTFESIETLRSVLDNFIHKGCDLGTTYGMIRQWWRSIPVSATLLSTFQTLNLKDTEARENALAHNMVVDPMMPPRRVWDLYSNRVLPGWAIESDLDVPIDSFQRIMPLFAVSHAWMFPAERQGVLTSINGYKWPVPIPLDSDLHSIRVELLKMGAEYVWLDVLCLRQKGGEASEEENRAKEWKLDVPTIGAVYCKSQNVIVYLNGLGRPFEENDLSSTRHWCNRAWTVQEWCLASSMSLAGITPQSPKFNLIAGRGPIAEGPEGCFPQRLRERMGSMWATTRYIVQGAAEMTRRSAESDLDKIAGLAYNFTSGVRPAFSEAQLVEDAWMSFVDSMLPRVRGDLLFLFPTPGEGKFKWLPSWRQLLDGAEQLANNDQTLSTELDSCHCPTLDQLGEYRCTAILLPVCRVEGLGDLTPTVSDVPREGTVVSLTHSAITFKAVAHHCYPVPDGTYTLLSNLGHYKSTCRFWIVGTLDDQGKRFSKLFTLQMNTQEIPNTRLFTALNLSEAGNGEDVSNMQSRWIRDIVLS
jgi:hypothetical protein